MSTTTPKLGLTKPDLGQDPWGALINADLDKLDSLAGVLGAEDDELPLYLDPATVSDTPQSGVLASGFAATPMPAGTTTRLLSKWKVRPAADLAIPLKLVLRFSMVGGAGENILLQVKTTPLQVAQDVTTATVTTTQIPTVPLAANIQKEVIHEFTLAAGTDIASIQIERLSDTNIGLVQFWGAWLRWGRKQS